VRVVAITRTPAASASWRQARPTEDVAPRSSSVSPGSRSRCSSEPAAVANVSGRRAEHVPRQRGVECDQLVLGDERVLGVAAIERAAHLPHQRRDCRPRRHGGRVPVHRLDHADQLDPEDPRERHRVAGVALERLVLGPVESERLDPDQRPAWTGLGARHLAYDEPLGPVRRLRDHCSHLRHAPRRY